MTSLMSMPVYSSQSSSVYRDMMGSASMERRGHDDSDSGSDSDGKADDRVLGWAHTRRHRTSSRKHRKKKKKHRHHHSSSSSRHRTDSDDHREQKTPSSWLSSLSSSSSSSSASSASLKPLEARHLQQLKPLSSLTSSSLWSGVGDGGGGGSGSSMGRGRGRGGSSAMGFGSTSSTSSRRPGLLGLNWPTAATAPATTQSEWVRKRWPIKQFPPSMLDPRKVTVVLGHSGSGKSYVTRRLARFRNPRRIWGVCTMPEGYDILCTYIHPSFITYHPQYTPQTDAWIRQWSARQREFGDLARTEKSLDIECCGIIDDMGTDKEWKRANVMDDIAAKTRQGGNKIFYLIQHYAQASPTVRNNCSEIVLTATTNMGHLKKLYEEFFASWFDNLKDFILFFKEYTKHNSVLILKTNSDPVFENRVFYLPKSPNNADLDMTVKYLGEPEFIAFGDALQRAKERAEREAEAMTIATEQKQEIQQQQQQQQHVTNTPSPFATSSQQGKSSMVDDAPRIMSMEDFIKLHPKESRSVFGSSALPSLSSFASGGMGSHGDLSSFWSGGVGMGGMSGGGVGVGSMSFSSGSTEKAQLSGPKDQAYYSGGRKDQVDSDEYDIWGQSLQEQQWQDEIFGSECLDLNPGGECESDEASCRPNGLGLYDRPKKLL